MLALTACGGDGGEASKGASEESTSHEPSERGAEVPGLEDVPDVVAEVNGGELTKDEFVTLYEARLQQAAMQAQSSGQQPDQDALKKQTVDNLVDTELLAQEAEARGIAVTDQDVDDELTDLAKQNQMVSDEELLAALEKQGTSEDEARAQVESQAVIERLVADEAGQVKPTERELRTVYEQAKQQMGQQQKIPPYAQVRSQLEEKVRAEQMGKVAQALVEKLRADADITINL